jgi:hypothetical protein
VYVIAVELTLEPVCVVTLSGFLAVIDELVGRLNQC